MFYKTILASSAAVVPMTATVLQSILDEAQLLLKLRLSRGEQTLYVLRHSGASADGWLQRRSPQESRFEADGSLPFPFAGISKAADSLKDSVGVRPSCRHTL